MRKKSILLIVEPFNKHFAVLKPTDLYFLTITDVTATEEEKEEEENDDAQYKQCTLCIFLSFLGKCRKVKAAVNDQTNYIELFMSN